MTNRFKRLLLEGAAAAAQSPISPVPASREAAQYDLRPFIPARLEGEIRTPRTRAVLLRHGVPRAAGKNRFSSGRDAMERPSALSDGGRRLLYFGCLLLFARLKPKNGLAILRAIGWNLVKLPRTMSRRRELAGKEVIRRGDLFPRVERQMPLGHLVTHGLSYSGEW